MGLPDGQALFQGWRVPCLGLTIIGKFNTPGSSDEFDIMYKAHTLRSTPWFFLISGAPSASPLHCRASHLLAQVTTGRLFMLPFMAHWTF